MQEEKLKTFEKKLRAIDELVVKEDFEKFLKFIVEFMTSLKKANAETLTMVKNAFDGYMEKMKSETHGEMTEKKKEVMEACETEMNKMIMEHEAMMSEMDKRASDMENAMPDEALIAKQASEIATSEVLKLIPPKDDFNAELSKAGELIANTISGLLEIDDIKGLKDLLEELRQLKGGRVLGGGGFSKIALDGHILDPYIPTGTINGVNCDFKASQTPNPAVSLKVYRGGQLQSLIEDYTVSGLTITFLTAPVVGEIIKVEHRI